MEQFTYAKNEQGLTVEEIKSALLGFLEGRDVKKVLILPPDFTRFHSGAGFITNVYYHALMERGSEVDILPALGTHEPVSKELLGGVFFLCDDRAASAITGVVLPIDAGFAAYSGV